MLFYYSLYNCSNYHINYYLFCYNYNDLIHLYTSNFLKLMSIVFNYIISDVSNDVNFLCYFKTAFTTALTTTLITTFFAITITILFIPESPYISKYNIFPFTNIIYLSIFHVKPFNYNFKIILLSMKH